VPPEGPRITGLRELHVPPILATDLTATRGRYLLLFLAVSASWAGVPFIGAATISMAAAAASQGQLNMVAVIIVAAVAAVAGDWEGSSATASGLQGSRSN